LGKLHFWLMYPAFFLQSLGQMRVGLLGMRRRIADYDPALEFDFSQLLVTIAGFIIFFAVVIFLFNMFKTLRSKEIVQHNPWKSRSPEWQLPYPIPEHNYQDHPFEVVGDPYDYGLEGSEYVRMVTSTETAAAD
jgi:cytochrome c oxidase subunit 1